MKLRSYVELLRPSQWLKNLMLFFPCFLGGTLLQPGVAVQGIVPFIAFCLASSTTYILNDVIDRERDRQHPKKCLRPIASVRVSVPRALALAGSLLLTALLLAVTVSGQFTFILVCYLMISSSYSLWLKEHPLFDLFCISSGFLLRLLAGAVVMGIVVTEWLFLSVFLLSIFLSTGKRLSEKQLLGTMAGNHRKVLAGYPEGFLEGTMYMTGGSVLVTYTMYVISRHSALLLYTVPLCCFGLLRYILRVQSGKGGDPTESLTQDIPLLIVGVAWAVLVGWGIYRL